MPWTPGIQLARLLALQGVLQSTGSLNIINAALAGYSNFLQWFGTGFITPAMIVRGDVQLMPPLAQYPLMFCVVGGGKYNRRDIRTERRGSAAPVGNQMLRNYLDTNVLIYQHEGVFSSLSDPVAQSTAREDLSALLSDAVRQVLNSPTNAVISLLSNETGNPIGNDVLDRCMAISGYMGFFNKSFEDSQILYGAHVVHRGMVAAG